MNDEPHASQIVQRRGSRWPFVLIIVLASLALCVRGAWMIFGGER
jgi:hypothetical protein